MTYSSQNSTDQAKIPGLARDKSKTQQVGIHPRDWFIFVMLLLSLIQRGPFNIIQNVSIIDIFSVFMALDLAGQLLSEKKGPILVKIPFYYQIAILVMVISEIQGFINYPILADTATKTLIYFAETVMLLLYVIHYCTTIERVERVLQLSVIAGIVLLVITIWESQNGILAYGPYFTLFGNTRFPDTPPGFIDLDTRSLPAFGLVFGYGVFKLRSSRVLAIGLSIAVAYVLAISTRRGAYICLIGFILAFVFLNSKRVALVYLAVGAIFAYTIIFSNTTVSGLDDLDLGLTRILAGEWYQGPTSATSVRFNVYTIALQMFLRHPFAGYGMGGFAKEFYADPSLAQLALDPTNIQAGNGVLSAHSQYLQVLVDYGIIVFVAFLGIVWALLRWSHGLSQADDPRFASIGKLLFVCYFGWFLEFLVDAIIYSPSTMKPTFFYVAAGLTFATYRLWNKQTAPANNRMKYTILRREPRTQMTAHTPTD